MLKAKLTLEDNDGIVFESLRPESERSLPRTDSDIRTNGRDIVITVTASDASAMRAALNSYLGWIRITENIERIT